MTNTGIAMQDTSSVTSCLFISDSKNSIVSHIIGHRHEKFSLDAFGYHHERQTRRSNVAFNGDLLERMPIVYLLGNGYRAYSPVYRAFQSPDALSPFGPGGVNSYAFCVGDPLNLRDPSGHAPLSEFLRRVLKGIAHKSTDKIPASLKKAKSLKNIHAHTLDIELRLSKLDQTAKPITRIKSQHELQELKTDHYKFIFTDQQELLVAPFGSLSHPVIASHAHSQRVMSAGAMRLTGNRLLRLSNHTGHYQADFESLSHVNKYLRGLGVEHKLVRYK